MAKVSDGERARIVELIKAGESRNEIVRKTGRSAGTITGIANQIDHPFDRSATKKATEAKRDYAQAERLVLLNEGFDKARDVLGNIALADDLKDWSVALGTLIDKRRLEDGEATSRSENISPERRKKMKESLDEVSARRRQNMAG